MRVYINWDTQEVLGPAQAGEAISRKYQEYCDDDAVFEDYLAERYTVFQIWELTAQERSQIMEDFNKFQEEEAEAWFDDEFSEYQIE